MFLCTLYGYVLQNISEEKNQLSPIRRITHTDRDTKSGFACSHVVRGIFIFFSPWFYLNPDLVQHCYGSRKQYWLSSDKLLSAAVNQSKKKGFGKHPAYRRSDGITGIYVFSIISVNSRLVYWKCLLLICVLESSKESVSYPVEFQRKASRSPFECLRCAWVSRDSWK